MAAELEAAVHFPRKILQRIPHFLIIILLSTDYYNVIISCTFASKILRPFWKRIKYLEQSTLQVGRNYGEINLWRLARETFFHIEWRIIGSKQERENTQGKTW